MATIRKITSDADFLSVLKLSSRAFTAKCPIFQFYKIPALDFVKYHYSMKSSLLSSKFLYALWVSNEIKATFMSIPMDFELSLDIPESMRYYDDFFTEKTNFYQKYLNKKKCLYALLAGSEYPGAGKLLYIYIYIRK